MLSYDLDNGFQTIFSRQKQIIELSDEVKLAFNDMFASGANINLDNWVGSFDKLAERLGTTDKQFISFLETTQKQGIVYANADDAMKAYQVQLKQTGNTMSWANVRAKALSASMKVLSSIGCYHPINQKH